MIIKVDNLNSKHYEKVFKDAYDKLLAAGKIAENELGRLTSLEEFFSHIADIYEADRSFLIKLPVDEPALVIDANKRTVDTTLFNKTATVQTDEVAEIAVFSVDRYFDYMDLATTEIWVQWTAPGADGVLREGATLIEMKDVETEPGKVRFGWPLDSEITAIPGNVQFAVRFFKRGNVEVPNLDGTSSIVNKVVYSLNTLPATLKISPVLQPELNAETELNKPQGLFTHSIINSIYSGKDAAIPQTPSFGAPGLDLPITATLHEDTLTLKAQAVVGDTGTIRYEWYYTPVGETVAKNVEEIGFGTIGWDYVEIDGTTEVLSERYYIKKDDGAYAEYLGNFPVADGIILYEKFTTFTVPVSGEVTGTYQVKAINSITAGNQVVDGKEQKSYPCILVSPSDVVIKEDLPLISIMKVAEGETEAKTNLVIIVERKSDDNSIYSYNWLKSLTPNKEDAVSVSDGYQNSNLLTITEPGWYTVNIKSELNRQVNEGASLNEKLTKVTFMPTVPIIDFDDEKYEQDTEDTNKVHTKRIAVGLEAELAVNPLVTNATSYDMNDLYSEGLTYQWFVSEPDKEEIRPLLSSEITKGDVNSNSVTMIVSAESKNNFYICEVTNHLNNESTKSELVFVIE